MNQNKNLPIINNFLDSKISIPFVIVCIILTLGIGVFLRPVFSAKRVEAVNQPALTPTSMDISEKANSTAPDLPIPTPEHPTEENMSLPSDSSSDDLPLQTQKEVNGIFVKISNVRFERDQLMIDTCYDLRDNSDWIVWDATLKIGDIETNNFGGIPISLTEALPNQKGQRCDTIYFENISPDSDFSTITFTIETILAQPYEGEVCEPEYLAKYQKALDAQNAGITVECFIEEFEGGGGMSGVRIASKPEAMSQEEAEAILHNHDFFLDLHGIQGPWVFSFRLDQ